MKRPLFVSICLFMLAGACVELYARFVLGLGSPPLSQPDPEMEYMFKPDQDVSRFHNRQLYNSYGMRSDVIGSDRRYTVLAFGDSVLNGGNQTDHDELATSRLQDYVTQRGDVTFVGNISAGSWGPGNIRAYIKRFGLFEADQLIFVFSSHDFEDERTFQPLDPTTHPTRKPLLATLEAAQRYLPRYVPAASFLKPVAEAHPYADAYFESVDHPSAEEDLHMLMSLSAERPVCVILHKTQSERNGSADIRYGEIRRLAEAYDITIVELTRYIDKLNEPGEAYRDNIHLSAVGQGALFEAMKTCLPNQKHNSNSQFGDE